jgi:hypothetical protein
MDGGGRSTGAIVFITHQHVGHAQEHEQQYAIIALFTIQITLLA